MRRCVPWQVVLLVVCGCSGGYVMTAGDQLAPGGGEAAAVIRLEQSELPVIAPPAKDVAVRFRVGEGPLRSARTDGRGYAAASVAVPVAPGTYDMTVAIQDTQGDEACWTVRTFVWDAGSPVVGVELEALPRDGAALLEARAALASLAQRASILYLTSHRLEHHRRCHQFLQARGLPDGPVLSWRKARWPGRGIISPLPRLRGQFPHLQVGIGASKLALAAFEQAGMKAVAIRKESGQSWAELGQMRL